MLRFLLFCSDFYFSGRDGASRFRHRRAVARVLQLGAAQHPLPPRLSKKMRSLKG
jgi:hypothetical protein